MAPLPTQPNSRNPYTPTHHYETPAPATGPAFTVSREEILAKRAALLAEANDFRQFLARIEDRLRMEPCGDDPVSLDVARAVTYRTIDGKDSYFKTCDSWVNNLFQTAEAMADVARQYGFTDDEIAASFTTGVPDA